MADLRLFIKKKKKKIDFRIGINPSKILVSFDFDVMRQFCLSIFITVYIFIETIALFKKFYKTFPYSYILSMVNLKVYDIYYESLLTHIYCEKK